MVVVSSINDNDNDNENSITYGWLAVQKILSEFIMVFLRFYFYLEVRELQFSIAVLSHGWDNEAQSNKIRIN